MGWQVIKQPNGLYAIWSTIVDGITMWDATEADIVQAFVDDAAEQARASAHSTLRDLNALPKGQRMFGRWLTWREAKRRHKEVHGALRESPATATEQGGN